MEEATQLTEHSTDELVKQAQEVAEANARMNPEEIAARFFMSYYPQYKTTLLRLNRKDAVRLADALVAWPLEIETPKFANIEGYNAFRVGTQLLDCKMVMRNAIEMENFQNAIDKDKEGVVSSSVENEAVINQGEKTNG